MVTGELKDKVIKQVGIPKLVIIVLAGVVLLVTSLPDGIFSGKNADTSDKASSYSEKALSSSGAEDTQYLEVMELYARNQEKKLKEILEQMDGIDEVNVMITLKSSEEKFTLKDTDESDGDISNENVIIENDGSSEPYVVQVMSPEIEGIVVVAKGNVDAAKESEITAVVEALFSVEAHKIKVIR